MRVTIQDITRMKAAGQKIAMLTAYDVTSAAIADAVGVPVLLVGNSLGMVVLGHDTTLPVTIEDMERHTAAVVRGSRQALVVGDLPFLSYTTEADAIANAGRLIGGAGAQAVKLEGAGSNLPIIRRLVELGIPVMGHLGFTPQSTHQLGIKVQAKAPEAAAALVADALALQAAGVFALVLELVPAELAQRVTAELTIPTIGIGAGPHCDGQVQVWHDILGLWGDKTPRHANRFGEIGAAIEGAVKAYVQAVTLGTFPVPKTAPCLPVAEMAKSPSEG